MPEKSEGFRRLTHERSILIGSRLWFDLILDGNSSMAFLILGVSMRYFFYPIRHIIPELSPTGPINLKTVGVFFYSSQQSCSSKPIRLRVEKTFLFRNQ